AVGVAKGAARYLVERREVSGEPVELFADACGGLAERIVLAGGTLSRVGLVVGHEARSVEAVADVSLEVLYLVEVCAPMHAAFPGSAGAEQRPGVAQTLAAVGEVPNAAVAHAAEVAGHAAHVARVPHPRIDRIEEDLL